MALLTPHGSFAAPWKWGLTFLAGMAAMAALLVPRPVAVVPASQASEAVGNLAATTVFAAPSRGDELSQAFRVAAQAVLPSIVQIRGRVQMGHFHRGAAWSDAIFDAGPFHGFAVDFSPGMGRQASDGSEEPALGSGIIIDSAGIVLTNKHLLDDVSQAFIQTPDGKRYPVTESRTDASTDLAVLRFEAPCSMPAARLGDSEALQIGDWVLTLGSPLDLKQTVSAGIISATGRKVDGAGDVELLQTDAAINPGSSGGALVNLRGEVVGVTTGIASEDGGYQGIGFAIPAKVALRVIAELRRKGL